MADYEKALSLIESGGGSGGGGIEYVGKYDGYNAAGGSIPAYGDVVQVELTGSGTLSREETYLLLLSGFSGPSGGDLIVSSISAWVDNDTDDVKIYASIAADNTTDSAVSYNDGSFGATYEVFKIGTGGGGGGR